MHPFMLALAGVAAVAGAQTSPPGVGPVGGHDQPWQPQLPDPIELTGFWPIDQLYGLSVDTFGRDRTEKWVKDGLKSLEKNLYRKHYIEQGYFLILLPLPGAPRDPGDDHMFFVPKDPANDPRVIFMKDIHRLAEGAGGMHESIVQSLLAGDKDLLKLAGHTMFDSKFTVKDWSYALGGKDFDPTKGKDRLYYYKFRQNGMTKIKLEAGIGKALQLGDAPIFIGGSVGVEAQAKLKYRLGELSRDAAPRAKLGVWGKMPWVEGASWGLSAIQGWHADDGRFENEFRVGVFQGSGQSTLGAVAYRRVSGADPFSPDSRALGGQLYYSPSDAIAFFLSGERVQSSGAQDEAKLLLGIELLARARADPSRWADEILGEKTAYERAEREAFFALAWKGSLYLRDGARAGDALESPSPEGLLRLLRETELESVEEFRLLLPGGVVLSAPPLAVLEAACSIEAKRFWLSNGGSEIPGWPGPHCRPLDDKEAVRELLGRLPADALSQVERNAAPWFHEQMARVILIHASAVRRGVDLRVTQSGALMLTVLEKAAADPYAKLEGSEGRELWTLAAGLGRERLSAMSAMLGRALRWLRQEHALEGRKWTAELAGYGRWLLEESARSPAWPRGFSASAQRDEDWAPILAGHGQQFAESLLAVFRAKAQSAPLSLRIFASPLPGQVRVRKHAEGSYSLEIPAAKPGMDHEKYLRESLATVEAALK